MINLKFPMQMWQITENICDYSKHSFESEYGGTLAKDFAVVHLF